MPKKKMNYRESITKARRPQKKKPLSRRFREASPGGKAAALAAAVLVVVGGFSLLRTGSSYLPGAGHYEIRNARVELAREGRRHRTARLAPRAPYETWKIHFTAEWVDGQAPPSQAQLCRYEVFDSAGESLKKGEFGLHVGNGPRDTTAPGVLSEVNLSGEPKTADVSC